MAISKSANRIFAIGRVLGATLLLQLTFALSASTQADNAEYFYDAGGRLTGIIDATGSGTYSYDQAGNITSVGRKALSNLGIVSFYPVKGRASTTVTVRGTGFGTTSNTVVKFNGVSATPSAVSQTSITVAVPSTATSGTLSVTVAGITASSGTFKVEPAPTAPTISSFTPTKQTQGSPVTVTGSNFDPLKSVVRVNGQIARITSATSTSLTFSVPPSSSGRLTVETPAGIVTSTSDLLVPPPSYTGASIVSSIRRTIDGTEKNITTGASGTVSLILFDGTAGQGLTSFLDGTTSTGLCSDASISIVGPDGFPIVQPMNYCTYEAWRGPVVLPRTGTYSFVILPTYGTAPTFKTRLWSVPVTADRTFSEGGTKATTLIATPGQQGTLTFAGTAGSSILVNLDFWKMNNGCNSFTILNPDGTTLVAPFETCQPWRWSNYGMPVPLTQSGTFSIKITPGLTNSGIAGTGYVTSSVFLIPSDLTAAIPTNGTPAVIQISRPGQKGIFTFAATSGQPVSIRLDFSNLSSCIWSYTVTDPNGTLVYSAYQRCDDLYWLTGTQTFTPAVTGTYKVTYTPWLEFANQIRPFGTGSINAGTGISTATRKPIPPAVAGETTTATAKAPALSVTAISGRVRSIDGGGLPNVKISNGSVSTVTDSEGQYLLEGVKPGTSVITLDARRAGPVSAEDYGYYEVRVTAEEGKTTTLPFTSWLPRIDHQHEVKLSPDKETVVTTPLIPGLELHIPAGAVLTGPDHKPVDTVSITPVPLDRTPAPLPANVDVPLYFTIQPGGATFSSADGKWIGAQLWYPNSDSELPGARRGFWWYDPYGSGWSVMGRDRFRPMEPVSSLTRIRESIV